MNPSVSPNLDRVIENLPSRFPGPGGAVAVVKDGIAIVRHAWGYADPRAAHSLHDSDPSTNLLHH